jgi:hypothetical protein
MVEMGWMIAIESALEEFRDSMFEEGKFAPPSGPYCPRQTA